MKSYRKWPLWVLLLLIALLGVVFIALSTGDLHWSMEALRQVAAEVGKELGVALVIAAVLGVTVDGWLTSKIAKDAFFGALGYILPPELREEVLWISKFDRICDRHFMQVRVERVSDDVVRVTCGIQRVIRNISNAPIKVKCLLHVDENGFEEKSKIIDCEMRKNGKAVAKYDGVTEDGMTLLVETPEITLGEGQTVELLSQAVELRRSRDEIHYNFLVPTNSPEVEVIVPDGFEHNAGFSNRSATRKLQYSNRYILDGVYLPHQMISVKWWPRKN